MKITGIALKAALVAAFALFSITALASERVEVEIGDSPSIGPADAPVTIIEFIDYQ